jgi:ribosomal protein L22
MIDEQDKREDEAGEEPEATTEVPESAKAEPGAPAAEVEASEALDAEAEAKADDADAKADEPKAEAEEAEAKADEPEAKAEEADDEKPKKPAAKAKAKSKPAESKAAPKPAPKPKKADDGAGPRPPVVRATARYVRGSARKARLVAEHLKGLTVEEAQAVLRFHPRGAAEDWSKLLKSAVANAENNHELLGEDLRIKEVYADEGPTLKRYRPRAMGRATRIRKRTAHLTITLTPKD